MDVHMAIDMVGSFGFSASISEGRDSNRNTHIHHSFLYSSGQPYEWVARIIILILQKRSLRHREVQ